MFILVKACLVQITCIVSCRHYSMTIFRKEFVFQLHMKRQERRQKLVDSPTKQSDVRSSISDNTNEVPKKEERVSDADPTTASTQEKKVPKKRKLDSFESVGKDGKYVKKMKVSSIFTKNPDIPRLTM